MRNLSAKCLICRWSVLGAKAKDSFTNDTNRIVSASINSGVRPSFFAASSVQVIRCILPLESRARGENQAMFYTMTRCRLNRAHLGNCKNIEYSNEWSFEKYGMGKVAIVIILVLDYVGLKTFNMSLAKNSHPWDIPQPNPHFSTLLIYGSSAGWVIPFNWDDAIGMLCNTPSSQPHDS